MKRFFNFTVACLGLLILSGYDTGDIIGLGKIKPEKGDSYFYLGWKSMKEQAEYQAHIILEFCKGKPIPRKRNVEIPKGSYYSIPTLSQYIKYILIQNKVR